MMVKNGPHFRPLGLRPEIVHAEPIIIEVYREAGRPVTWSSGADRTHSRNSLHYSGNAVDVYWDDVNWGEGESVADEISYRLGQDYDVIKEYFHS